MNHHFIHHAMQNNLNLFENTAFYWITLQGKVRVDPVIGDSYPLHGGGGGGGGYCGEGDRMTYLMRRPCVLSFPLSLVKSLLLGDCLQF